MINDTPKIEGLSYRNYQGTSDLQEMVSVREKSKDHDRVDPLSTLESIPSKNDLVKTLDDNNCEPSKDILIVEMNGEVIGYCKIGWWTESDGVWLYLHNGFLVPNWRGKGIGTAMLHWSQKRIGEIADNHQINGKGMFGSNATTTEIEKTKLLLDDGY